MKGVPTSVLLKTMPTVLFVILTIFQTEKPTGSILNPGISATTKDCGIPLMRVFGLIIKLG